MVYTSTSTRSSGAGDLVEYVERERAPESERVVIHDLSGKELSQEEIDEFIEQSESDGFERHVFLSTDPENDVSVSEMHEKTQNVANRYVDDRPTASFVYGVHDDTDKLHSHVAFRGEKRDLWHDGDDLEELKIDAEREFKDAEAAHELAENLDVDLSQEQEQELGLADDLDRSDDLDLGVESADLLDVDQEQEIAAGESIEIGDDRDQDLGMGMGR